MLSFQILVFNVVLLMSLFLKSYFIKNVVFRRYQKALKCMSLSFDALLKGLLQSHCMTCTDTCIHHTNCPFKGEGLFFVNVSEPTFSLLRLFLVGSAIFLKDQVPMTFP